MKTVKILLAAGLMTIMGATYAQPGEGYRGERNNQREVRQRGHAGLELTDEQQAKAEELKLNMQKAALPLKNELGENRAKMRTLTTAENPDMKAINKLIDNNAELRADLEKLRAAKHQEFRKMLTDEQRVKFDSKPQGRYRHGANARDSKDGRGRDHRGQGQQNKGQLK
jgi:Spy/CpxP family protein refolding chaperone